MQRYNISLYKGVVLRKKKCSCVSYSYQYNRVMCSLRIIYIRVGRYTKDISNASLDISLSLSAFEYLFWGII